MDQTTSHMLREVKQVQKNKKKNQDPPMAFRYMATRINQGVDLEPLQPQGCILEQIFIK